MKATGGGRFDRQADPIYFLAGDGDYVKHRAPNTLMALNEIMGGKRHAQELERRLDAGENVFLDSGIFWLTNQHARAHDVAMDEALALHPSKIDGFDALRAAYVATVKKYEHQLWGFVELDQGGAERKRETRAALEAEGIVPIPVYHPLNDGWDYFDELCESYDRICVGNVVQAERSVRKRILATVWERHRRHPDVWVHVLGLTPNELIGTYPFNSCDSSTFIASLRWGADTTPYATSCLKRVASADSRYSYDPHRPVEHREKVSQMIHTASHHLHAAWRVQQRDMAQLVPSLPPVERWEKDLR